MARPKNDQSQDAIAARLTIGLRRIVTRKCVREWQAKGYPLDDIPALEKKLRNQERSPKAVEEPKSQGSIPVEFAAKREIDLMFHVIDVVTENFVGMSAEEMRKNLYVGMLLSYDDFYGGVLGDRDELVRRIKEHKLASEKPS